LCGKAEPRQRRPCWESQPHGSVCAVAPAFPIERSAMFFHRKELMFDVKVQGADPRFGEMLLEQFGGATGS